MGFPLLSLPFTLCQQLLLLFALSHSNSLLCPSRPHLSLQGYHVLRPSLSMGLSLNLTLSSPSFVEAVDVVHPISDDVIRTWVLLCC